MLYLSDMNEKIYLELAKSVHINKCQDIYIKDIATIYSKNKKAVKDISNIKIYKSKKHSEISFVFTSLDLIKLLDKTNDYTKNLILTDNMQCVIHISITPNKLNALLLLKLSLLVFIFFFGSGITVMHFHEDVNMINAHSTIYKSLTGNEADNLYYMEFAYSIGIGIGMALFFFRTKKKSSSEPHPLDLEFYNYEKMIDSFLIDTYPDEKKDND